MGRSTLVHAQWAKAPSPEDYGGEVFCAACREDLSVGEDVIEVHIGFTAGTGGDDPGPDVQFGLALDSTP